MGSLKEILQKRNALRESVNALLRKIKAGPECEHITKVGENAFTIKSSNLADSLSPAYYDFKQQYEFICAKIKAADDPVNAFNKIVREGKVQVNKYHAERLHPDVIEYLKSLVQDE